MAEYKLHKSTGFVKINALLEERQDQPYGDCITFQRILNNTYASYRPVTLIVPDNIKAEVYEATYGHVFLSTSIAGPQQRLALYDADGKRYAYIDYYERDADGVDEMGYSRDGQFVGRGRKIRARFAIVEEV